MSERDPIGVVGVGWVGLVSAACFAELGHDVWCRDIDGEKIAALRNGKVSIYEPELQELVVRNAERLHFETDFAPVLEHVRLLFVCVDTPPTYSGDADLSHIDAVIAELPDSPDHAIVMKSTVPVGTGASISRRLGELGKPGLGYASNPEFLKEGSAVKDFMHPYRVVVGDDDRSPWAADAVAELYGPLGCEVVRTDVASAEMIKMASNAFLATKISFINEIANVCEEVGADVREVADGMGLDPRIGASFLDAGIGYGGSCLVGDETVVVRRGHQTWTVELSHLFDSLAQRHGSSGEHMSVVCPEGLEALCWDDSTGEFAFRGVAIATRRDYAGDLLAVRTESGASITCTPDHPLVVRPSNTNRVLAREAGEAALGDLVPIAPATFLDALRGRSETLALGAPRAASLAAERPARELPGTRATWTRLTEIESLSFDGHVYSLEVPGPHTFVTSGGLVVHNCFPKDVSALKQLAGNSGYHFQLLNAVIEVNELQKRRVVNKLKKHLGSLIGKKVALLGLAFKPNTDDMREASSVVLASRLQGEGAEVRAYDPVAEDSAARFLSGVEMSDSAFAALDGADAAVIVTEWPEFADLDLAEARARMANPLIIDGRNMLDPRTVKAAGFRYEGIGRSSNS